MPEIKKFPAPVARDLRMLEYSEETRRKIRRAIELNPAMEELILDIAESANIDGMSE
jgi:hypothetical protein